MKKWPGLQLPLIVKHQSQRNMARALVRLWGQVVEAYPEDAYATAAMLIYRDVHEEPWSNKDKLTLWFQALGGDTYFKDGNGNGRIHWTAVVEYLITEVSCQTCPIAQLPKQPLRSDLSQGQGGVFGMPCRVGQTATRCIHGLASEDSFEVRVPWDWSEHPGVVGEGGDYRVKSYEDLLAAWQAQAAKEQAENEAATAVTVEAPQPFAAQTTSQNPAERPSPTSQPPPNGETPPSEPVAPPKDSPIAKQRAQISDFMQRHEQLAERQALARHPFATSCHGCRHHLETSPTKDETVPHCAWAGRLRNVSFKVLQSPDEQAPRIPVCRQFAPTAAWHEQIPAHPSPPGVPRDWLKEQILHLVRSANQQGSNRNAFEFLTGRPMSSNETYSDWFVQQFEAEIGNLNHQQLFTLFIWAHAEWQRARGKAFSLPVNDQSMQFATYHERPYPVKEAA